MHLANGTNVLGCRIDGKYKGKDNGEEDCSVSTVVRRLVNAS